MIVVVSERLNASGWPAPLRGALIVLPALFWAASLAAASEAVLPRGVRPGPARLALIGALALGIAESLAAFGGWVPLWGG